MIGFNMPYAFGEQTQAALALCELAERLGCTATITSSQVELGVSAQWDKVVEREQSVNFKQWLSRCSHVIWTDVRPEQVKLSKRMGRKNILLTFWHRLTPEARQHWGLYDHITCPGQQIYQFVSDRWPCAQMTWCPWDPQVAQITQRKGRLDDRRLRLFVPMVGADASVVGAKLFYAFELLLSHLPHLEISLAYTKQWSRGALEALGSLQKYAKGRLTVLRKPSQHERLAAYLAADWTLCPSVRENTGHFALESLFSGTPVIGFDSPPLNNIISQGHNGSLLSCGRGYDQMGVPYPEPGVRELVDGLLGVLESSDLLGQTQVAVWNDLGTRRLAAMYYWRNLWDADTLDAPLRLY